MIPEGDCCAVDEIVAVRASRNCKEQQAAAVRRQLIL
jgi:hypothetical protein